MTEDPVRLLDEGGSDLLRTLISAAREEEPEAAAMQRTLVAVGVGAVFATAASSASGAAAGAGAAGSSAATGVAALGTAKGATSSTLVVVAKWLTVGALTGTVASSAIYRVSGALAPAAAVSSAPAPTLQNTTLVPQSLPRPPVAAKDLTEIPPPPAVVAAVPAAAPEPGASPVAVDSGSALAPEVAALDGARQALGSGDAARTLDLLSGYETRFPEGRMLPEALYLRLEALTLNGDRSSAEAVARRILRVYPSSPHAARARTVLGLDK